MLNENDRTKSLSSSDCRWERLVWERMQELCVADCVVVVSSTAVEPMEEDKKEEDTEVNMEEYSSTEDLVPWKVVAPWATMHVTPGFKATGPSDKV